MRQLVSVSLPDSLLTKLKVYCEVSHRSLQDVIEALLHTARVDHLPIAWHEHIDPERYAQQLAAEDPLRGIARALAHRAVADDGEPT
jgi:hypothetical protein